jgi:hypothetical protein
MIAWMADPKASSGAGSNSSRFGLQQLVIQRRLVRCGSDDGALCRPIGCWTSVTEPELVNKGLPLMKQILVPHFFMIGPGSASPPDTIVLRHDTRSGSIVPRTDGVKSDQVAFNLRIAPAGSFMRSTSEGTQTVAPTVRAERISMQLASKV